MIRNLRRLAVMSAIGCLGLVATFAAVHLNSFNSEQSDFNTIASGFVRSEPAMHLYSSNEDVSERSNGSALSYHRRDGAWVFQVEKSVALDRRGDMPDPLKRGDYWQYATFKDGSLEFLAQTADGSANISRQTFFPLAKGQDELLGRHPELTEKYADDGKTVADSLLQWYSGKTRQSMHVDVDGRKHVIVYAEDGVTALSERVFNKAINARTPPVLTGEKRWLNNPQHSLFYVDEQNQDGTRSIVDRDENGDKLWEAIWAKDDIVPGTIVDGYFPGTKKLRFHSESEPETDNVEYFRENGTLSAHVAINHMTLSIDYYDESGRRLRLSQNFARYDGPDFDLDKSSYSLTGVTEYGADGKETREFSLYKDHLSLFEKVDDTVNGVTYAKVAYFFGPQGLSLVSYWKDPNNLNGGPDDVDRDPKFAKVAPAVPADERTLQIVFGDDMLPVPPVQVSEHGS
ncbi:MAG: hypothetical protein P4L53_06490 [Candidatus Obscuribacterales bacterium]|nr:hypothetical protein [Candidatus Obscuribacterales bacterium]